MRTIRMLLLVLLLGAGVAWAQDLPYSVTLEGVDDADLRGRIEGYSRLFTLRERPPGSTAALRRRADDDLARIDEVLRARGHYGARTTIDIETATEPATVTIRVEPGPVYTLAAFRAASSEPDPAARPIVIPLDAVNIAIGRPAIAAEIVAAQQTLLGELANRSYPLAKVVERKAVVNHDSRTMAVDLLIDTGPLARFGAVTVTGLESIDEAYVRRRLPWREGEPYSPAALEEARQRLADTQLFSSVRLDPAEAVDEQRRLPVTVTLAEREQRSIGGGIGYSTSEGPNVSAFWEHRNLFEGAERLHLEAEYSFIRTALDGTYREPDVLLPDMDLLSGLTFERLTTEGFDSTTARASTGLEWRYSPLWTFSGAAALEYSVEEEPDGTRRFTLASLPLEARRDSSDDLLDPTRGGRLIASLTPYLDLTDTGLNFLRAELYDAVYFKLADEPRIVAAGWARIGTIIGADTSELPPTKRFYAGGGGSVRGYGYQLAGPLDAEDDPAGGRSLVSFGTELRIRITDTIGLVPFIEAGTVYPQKIPDAGTDLRWGTGLGIRYFTPIGPVRADIAFPLDPRPGIDDRFQIYLSLGQAF